MFDEVDLTRFRASRRGGAGTRALRPLSRPLSRAVEAGAIRDIDPEMQTLIGWSAVHGFAMLVLSGRLPPPRMPDADLAQIRDAFLGVITDAFPPVGAPSRDAARRLAAGYAFSSINSIGYSTAPTVARDPPGGSLLLSSRLVVGLDDAGA